MYKACKDEAGKMALHLVTGGAGFIGSSIAETLLKSGETVRILEDRKSVV